MTSARDQQQQFSHLRWPARSVVFVAAASLTAATVWYMLGERHIFEVAPDCAGGAEACRVSVGLPPDSLTSVALIVTSFYAWLMALTGRLWILGPSGVSPYEGAPKTEPLIGGEQPPKDTVNALDTDAGGEDSAQASAVPSCQSRERLLSILKPDAVAQLANEWRGIEPNESLLQSIREVRTRSGRGNHAIWVRLQSADGKDHWYRVTNGGRGKTTSTVRSSSGSDSQR
jgi:hypothetical protein